MNANRNLIRYEVEGEWSGYTLNEREDGKWIYEQWSAVQGCSSGRKVIIDPPSDIVIHDEADMDTRITDWGVTKAEYLLYHGREVRCLNRGHTVQ